MFLGNKWLWSPLGPFSFCPSHSILMTNVIHHMTTLYDQLYAYTNSVDLLKDTLNGRYLLCNGQQLMYQSLFTRLDTLLPLNAPNDAMYLIGVHLHQCINCCGPHSKWSDNAHKTIHFTVVLGLSTITIVVGLVHHQSRQQTECEITEETLYGTWLPMLVHW